MEQVVVVAVDYPRNKWMSGLLSHSLTNSNRQTDWQADGRTDRGDSQPLECSTICINLSHDISCILMTAFPYLIATEQYCDQPLHFASPVPAVYLMKLLLRNQTPHALFCLNASQRRSQVDC